MVLSVSSVKLRLQADEALSFCTLQQWVFFPVVEMGTFWVERECFWLARGIGGIGPSHLSVAPVLPMAAEYPLLHPHHHSLPQLSFCQQLSLKYLFMFFSPLVLTCRAILVREHVHIAGALNKVHGEAQDSKLHT